MSGCGWKWDATSWLRTTSRAQRGRQLLIREVREALGGRDGLLLPSMPVPATKLGVPTVSLGGTEETVRNITLRLTQLFNITGIRRSHCRPADG